MNHFKPNKNLILRKTNQTLFLCLLFLVWVCLGFYIVDPGYNWFFKFTWYWINCRVFGNQIWSNLALFNLRSQPVILQAACLSQCVPCWHEDIEFVWPAKVDDLNWHRNVFITPFVFTIDRDKNKLGKLPPTDSLLHSIHSPASSVTERLIAF